MIENEGNKRAEYRKQVNEMGKKEFTLLKMQEYGFWPKNVPTPYERQENETKEEYEERKALVEEYNKIIEEIDKLYEEKTQINLKFQELRKKYDETWDYEKIRKDISKSIMEESIKRRKERKEKRELEKKEKSEKWRKKREEEIVFIGKGYSSLLQDKETDKERLISQNLPIIENDKDLAKFLEIEYSDLRRLAYHRDVVKVDNYNRYTIPKKKGGYRNIASPKPLLKKAQRKILDGILSKISVSECANGFLKGKSVVVGAECHKKSPDLLINMDLENFFPTINFKRVRGMFKGFGYSGYISSLLAMLCTYCERMEIEVKGEKRYVKTTERILPQGSPASPMITNIICLNLDKRLNGVASLYNAYYTRYADDMSFSFPSDKDLNVGKFMYFISKIIKEEGFNINQNKTKFLRKNNRQSITGIVINNEEIGVPRKWIRNFRATIYNAEKLKKEGKLSLKTINEIKGKAAWIKSVNEKRYKDIIEEAYKVIE